MKRHFRFATLGLLAAATLPCSAVEQSISPIELLKSDRESLFDNSTRFRVRFEIGAVERRTTHFPDDSKHDVPHLAPTDTGDFTVPLSHEIETALQRIGVVDLDKHFTGKTITVEGVVGQTGLNLIGRDTIWTYHITIRSLEQIVELVSPENERTRGAAIDRPTFGTLDEFFQWADGKLAGDGLSAIYHAQSNDLEDREAAMRSLRLLRAHLDGKPLAEVFEDREFPTSYDRFRLGGHAKELGHCHIDFVQANGRWMLERIWHCR